VTAPTAPLVIQVEAREQADGMFLREDVADGSFGEWRFKLFYNLGGPGLLLYLRKGEKGKDRVFQVAGSDLAKTVIAHLENPADGLMVAQAPDMDLLLRALALGLVAFDTETHELRTLDLGGLRISTSGWDWSAVMERAGREVLRHALAQKGAMP
jgi:hypothetical protein